MFELAVKAHGLLGHHIQGLQQNPSYVPLGPNEVCEAARPAGGGGGGGGVRARCTLPTLGWPGSRLTSLRG